MLLESPGGLCEAIMDGLESTRCCCEAICIPFHGNIDVFKSPGCIQEAGVTLFKITNDLDVSEGCCGASL